MTAAEVEGSEITPLYQKLFSARAKDSVSENVEILQGVDRIRVHAGRGIWTIDWGGDSKRLLEPLLEREERFVIRSTGHRSVINRQKRRVTVHHLGADCRLGSARGDHVALPPHRSPFPRQRFYTLTPCPNFGEHFSRDGRFGSKDLIFFH